MRILYVLGFGFVFSVAAVTAQTAPQTQAPPVNPTTPAHQIGDGAQSKAGTPVTPSATSPTTTGGVAGAASSSTAQNPDVQTATGGVNAMTDSDLESQIQNALSKEPTLTGDSPRVNVTGDTVTLLGAVGTNKEKITATRIVQSYSGSKKLDNRLTINARSDKSSATDNSNRGRQAANPATTSKPPQR